LGNRRRWSSVASDAIFWLTISLPDDVDKVKNVVGRQRRTAMRRQFRRGDRPSGERWLKARADIDNARLTIPSTDKAFKQLRLS